MLEEYILLFWALWGTGAGLGCLVEDAGVGGGKGRLLELKPPGDPSITFRLSPEQVESMKSMESSLLSFPSKLKYESVLRPSILDSSVSHPFLSSLPLSPLNSHYTLPFPPIFNRPRIRRSQDLPNEVGKSNSKGEKNSAGPVEDGRNGVCEGLDRGESIDIVWEQKCLTVTPSQKSLFTTEPFQTAKKKEWFPVVVLVVPQSSFAKEQGERVQESPRVQRSCLPFAWEFRLLPNLLNNRLPLSPRAWDFRIPLNGRHHSPQYEEQSQPSQTF